jgi:hypothetical protein
VTAGPSLAPIVRALGGELYDGGRRANVPAPGHSPADRSVSLLLDGARVVVWSFGAADWREVLAHLRTRGLVDAAGRLCGASTAPAAPCRPLRAERVRRARQLWAEAGPLAGGLSEAHLRRRGVRRPGGEQLRHHSALATAAYLDRGPRRPALLAAIREPAGSLCGVEATYLDPGGGRARLRIPRKTLGTRPPGAAVRLDPAAAEMLVGEGVFTALSASERFGLPAWALMAAGNLAAWSPPAGVDRVLIAADRGAAGEAAAAALAARLARRGIACETVLPPRPFLDWNEAAGG